MTIRPISPTARVATIGRRWPKRSEARPVAAAVSRPSSPIAGSAPASAAVRWKRSSRSATGSCESSSQYPPKLRKATLSTGHWRASSSGTRAPAATSAGAGDGAAGNARHSAIAATRGAATHTSARAASVDRTSATPPTIAWPMKLPATTAITKPPIIRPRRAGGTAREMTVCATAG